MVRISGKRYLRGPSPLDWAQPLSESDMSVQIDYFLSPQSPWTYLGHARFTARMLSVGVPKGITAVPMMKPGMSLPRFTSAAVTS